MIKELSELGKRLREENLKSTYNHDALIKENVNVVIVIDQKGNYKTLLPVDKKTIVEDVIRMEDKGRTSSVVPRFIVDNSKYVLKYPKTAKRSIQCHEEYLKKINRCNLADIEPIKLFYKNIDSFNTAYDQFEKSLADKSIKDGNICFLLSGESEYIHEKKAIIEHIKQTYEDTENERKKGKGEKCSVCGSLDKRTSNIATHGNVKRVPDGQSSGCSLVSYNADAFESYHLIGNDNSQICTGCIKNYIYSLNWLLSNGNPFMDKKGKEHLKYTNRKNFGSDTAMIYWTRENKLLDELALLEDPNEKQVGILIDSVVSGNEKTVHAIQEDVFYSCTLSGAAARIAVRDWIEVSLSKYRRNIGQWFKDIAIKSFGETYYAPLYWLARAGHNEKSDSDTTLSRAANHLWNAALKNSKPPLWLLSTVLKRLRYIEPADDGKRKNDPVTKERAALIRLILNRNRQEGGYEMNEQLDKENLSSAYVCGHIFAVMVDIQRTALGKNINAGIRERFFSFASTTPASAFGRLMKLSQTHLTKLKGEKPGLSIFLDRELQSECAKLKDNTFPAILSLEEQGQFALGYYHKKEETWQKAMANKELKEVLENEEEEK